MTSRAAHPTRLRRPPDAAIGRSALLALSRAGFEGEAATDLVRAAAALGIHAAPTAVAGSGYVNATADGLDATAFRRRIAAHPPIFARSAIVGSGPHAIASEDQPARADRMPSLLAAIDDLARDPAQAPPWCSVWVEYPDTNDGKALTRLARALQSRLEVALGEAGRIDANADCRLHVFLRGRPHGLDRHECRRGDALAARHPPSAPCRSSALAFGAETRRGDRRLPRRA